MGSIVSVLVDFRASINTQLSFNLSAFLSQITAVFITMHVADLLNYGFFQYLMLLFLRLFLTILDM